MPISDAVSLVGGAALGAPFSEFLKVVIAEAKKVKDFKSLSQDLASTMESLVPLLKEIDLMQEGLDPGEGELKDLIKTMRNAEEIIRKCSSIRWYNIAKKVLYTREIKGIKQDLLRFCQIKLQVIQYKNHLHFVRSMASVTTKIDLLSDRGNEFTELCLEPQPEEATIFWLDRPLRELKKILFEDGMVTIVVSAPSACGKTTLVTKLCHDADVKGKFKQVFFISLSKNPNVRHIIQRLVWHTSGIVNEIEKELDARLCIKQLLKKLQQCGPILLVLDDAQREEESLLEKIMFQFPHCKLLVTSRFEFPRLGPTYHLEPLIDEDVKNLFIDCVPLPNCLSCAKRDDLLQKMLKRCNGIPLAFNPLCSMCGGCNSAIKDGISVNVLGRVWHPECFCCLACHKPIAIHEFSNSEGKFHKSCYKHRLPNSYVCKEKIPSNAEGIEYNEHPFCLEYNEHPFWLEKESGKKCIMLSAMSLSIIWGDTPQYWQWIPIPETRFHKVAELMDVCWFEIRGRLYTRGLSPRTRYSAYIVFKRTNECYGFENVAIEAGVGVVGEEATRRLIGFGQNRRRNLVKPEEREDGWMEIELGDFVSEGGLTNSGEIEMSVLETKQLHWKRGLIIQGIEIRPSKIQ